MAIRRRNIDEDHRPAFLVEDFQASSIADKVIGIVPVKCELVGVKEVHGTKGSDGSAVTLAIERLQGTETSGNGDSVATGVNLKGTADTVQSGTLATDSTVEFSAGNRVGVDVTGTTTAVANMNVSCYFRPID